MLHKRMEETQLAMVSDMNEYHQLHTFCRGNSMFLDTRLLPVGYANLNPMGNNGVHLRRFQHPYIRLFNIQKMVGENAVVLDILAHWRLHPVFNVVVHKLSKVYQT